MRKKLFYLYLLMFFSINIFAQTTTTANYTIVGQVSNDENMKQIQMRYQNAANVYFTVESTVNGIEQISNAIAGKQINNLQIFIKNDQTELFLTSNPIDINNINNYSDLLLNWKNSISGKVIIHNNNMTASVELNNLINQLKLLTGIDFEIKY